MINVTATGIFNKLKGDVALMTALGGVAGNGYKIYHVIAPQTAVLPYISFGLVTDSPLGDFDSQVTIEDSTWWFNVFSKTGSKNAGSIAKSMMTVLDNAALTITGYNALDCEREFIGSPIYDPETAVYQIPLRYRIRVNKT